MGEGTVSGSKSEFDGRAVLRSLWEHHWWSLNRIIAEARTLSEEEFKRPLGISYGSFHGALAHLIGSEQVWLERILRGASMSRVPGAEELPDLAAMEEAWRSCQSDWKKIFDGADLARVIHYANTKGAQFTDEVWQIMTHIVDHGTAYRGTLITALRLLGRTPPATGLVMYTRQKGE